MVGWNFFIHIGSQGSCLRKIRVKNLPCGGRFRFLIGHHMHAPFFFIDFEKEYDSAL